MLRIEKNISHLIPKRDKLQNSELVLEMNLRDILVKSKRGRVSKIYDIETRSIKYDPSNFAFYCQARDKNGSGNWHNCFVQLDREPKNYVHAMKLMKGNDIKVDCDCQSFRYHFKFLADKDKYLLAGQAEKRPPVKMNPYRQGSVCKHLQHILLNVDSVMEPFRNQVPVQDYANDKNKISGEKPDSGKRPFPSYKSSGLVDKQGV